MQSLVVIIGSLVTILAGFRIGDIIMRIINKRKEKAYTDKVIKETEKIGVDENVILANAQVAVNVSNAQLALQYQRMAEDTLAKNTELQKQVESIRKEFTQKLEDNTVCYEQELVEMRKKYDSQISDLNHRLEVSEASVERVTKYNEKLKAQLVLAHQVPVPEDVPIIVLPAVQQATA